MAALCSRKDWQRLHKYVYIYMHENIFMCMNECMGFICVRVYVYQYVCVCLCVSVPVCK